MGFWSALKNVGKATLKWGLKALPYAAMAIPFVGPVAGVLAKLPLLGKAVSALSNSKLLKVATGFVSKFFRNPLMSKTLTGLATMSTLFGGANSTLQLLMLSQLFAPSMNTAQIAAQAQGRLTSGC